MRLVANGTLSGSKKLKAAQGRLQSLSKNLTPGGHYRLIFPMTEDKDLVVANVPGRNCDYDRLKVGFIPLSDFEETDSGRIIDKSCLPAYTRMANVILEAQCNLEMTDAKRQAKEIADQLHKGVIQEGDLQVKLKEIDTEYHGNYDVTPVVYATVSPIISGLKILAATECIVIPLDGNGKPEWTKKYTASVDLNSKRKVDQLSAILANNDYCHEGDKFLEVDYNYVGEDKKAAGQNAAFAGCSKDVSLATKDPDGWNAAITEMEGMLSFTAEAIAARNMSMSANVTVTEAIERFKKYMSKQAILWPQVDMESDITKRAAKDFVASGIVDSYETIKSKLIALAEVTETEDAATDTSSSAPAALKEAADNQSLAGLNAAGEDLEAMLAQQNANDEGMAEL